MPPFDNNSKDRPRMWKKEAGTQDGHTLLKVDRYFRPVQSSFSNREVFRKNMMNDILQKKRLQIMKSENST